MQGSGPPGPRFRAGQGSGGRTQPEGRCGRKDDLSLRKGRVPGWEETGWEELPVWQGSWDPLPDLPEKTLAVVLAAVGAGRVWHVWGSVTRARGLLPSRLLFILDLNKKEGYPLENTASETLPELRIRADSKGAFLPLC